MDEETGHNLDDPRECWCHPTLDYKDPVTGAELWVHNEPGRN